MPRSASAIRSISAPWIARRPSGLAACANSIEPETPLWSVTAIAECPGLDRGGRQLSGRGRAVQEREGGVGVELDVGHEHMFAFRRTEPHSLPRPERLFSPMRPTSYLKMELQASIGFIGSARWRSRIRGHGAALGVDEYRFNLHPIALASGSQVFGSPRSCAR